jgi:hypothetical protein
VIPGPRARPRPGPVQTSKINSEVIPDVSFVTYIICFFYKFGTKIELNTSINLPKLLCVINISIVGIVI